jgi:hypothetical protein
VKKNKLRNALLKTLALLSIATCILIYVIWWIAQSDDSEFARKARDLIGIPQQSQEDQTGEPPTPPDALTGPDPFDMPEETKADQAQPSVSKITFAELARNKRLWPDELRLKLNVEVSIRYNGNNYGYMKFPRGRTVQVVTIMQNGEVLCEMDGNFLNLSVYETDFYGWFKKVYGDFYELPPVTVEFESLQQSRYSIGTKEGESAFWAEIREWCLKNYDSPLLNAEEDGLVFYWAPKEKVPINFADEAREIARQYLLRRAKYGSRENFAPCEIKNPKTRETLGTSSLFIPRL